MKGMRSWAEIDLAKLERNLKLIRGVDSIGFQIYFCRQSRCLWSRNFAHCIATYAKRSRSICGG